MIKKTCKCNVITLHYLDGNVNTYFLELKCKFMSIFHIKNLDQIKNFENQSYKLAIMKRSRPREAIKFFQKLLLTPFGVYGEVRRKYATDDIKFIIDNNIPSNIKNDSFYDLWIKDMASLCISFSKIENSSDISFWVGSERGCRRYHIDNVPQRLLVTYSGEGTEWIPDEAADKNAYLNGESNESILVNNSAKQFISEWNVAIFKGGSNGILHRTPDTALNKPSILMRLDHTKYWQAIYNKM